MSVKLLFLDIETTPMLNYTWGIWEQNVALNQIHTDWSVLSWAAKWQGSSKVHYKDLRKSKDKSDDKELVKGIWALLDEADVIVTQNGKEFDAKRLNSRFAIHGLKPPKPYKHIDTLKLAKKYFGFTSNKLEYLTNTLCTKYKKLTHKKFPGFELWKECLNGNQAAWREMEQYNKHDVLSLEELYNKLIPWDNSVNFSLYRNDDLTQCSCGSVDFQRRGFRYTATGKYQHYYCKSCGSWHQSGKNLNEKKRIKDV